MTDVNSEIGATSRQVVSRATGEGETRTVILTRAYPTGLADMWDACTNPERILRWFLPVSGDLQAGGRFQLEGNAGRHDRGVRPAPRLPGHAGVRRGDELD